MKCIRSASCATFVFVVSAGWVTQAKSAEVAQVRFGGEPRIVSPIGATKPVAHWKFDEGSGRTARDVTGRFDGQLSATGSELVSGGVAGGAIRLDRTQNGYVQMPPLPGLVSSNFTVAFWAKLPPGDQTGYTIPLSLHEAWFENGFVVFLNDYFTHSGPGRVGFQIHAGSRLATSKTLVNDGNWHQIVLVYDRLGRTSLYVDGAPAEASIPSAPVPDQQPPLMIGGLYGNEIAKAPNGYFTGWIDDVQVYAEALTDTQIDLLLQKPGLDLSAAGEAKPMAILPAAGEFVGSVTVSIQSFVAEASVRYTLDGSEPNLTSTRYQEPFVLTESKTVKVRLFVNEFPASEIVAATFTELPSVRFVPASGFFTNSLTLVLENALHLGGIRYTTDGTEPTATSPEYGVPILLSTATTVTARVFLNGFPVSDAYSAGFTRVYAIDDGIPNDWRERYFGADYRTDPRVAADADPDADGWSNRSEYLAGTLPTDKASAPAIVVGVRAVPSITWNSLTGLNYRVLRKASASLPQWEVVLAEFTAVAATSRFVDAEAPATAIYQVELVPEGE